MRHPVVPACKTRCAARRLKGRPPPLIPDLRILRGFSPCFLESEAKFSRPMQRSLCPLRPITAAISRSCRRAFRTRSAASPRRKAVEGGSKEAHRGEKSGPVSSKASPKHRRGRPRVMQQAGRSKGHDSAPGTGRAHRTPSSAPSAAPAKQQPTSCGSLTVALAPRHRICRHFGQIALPPAQHCTAKPAYGSLHRS